MYLTDVWRLPSDYLLIPYCDLFVARSQYGPCLFWLMATFYTGSLFHLLAVYIQKPLATEL